MKSNRLPARLASRAAICRFVFIWSNEMICQAVVILGAARSGTNILRDVLSSLPGVGTWPCDEINYIWRHGNANHPTDEFTAEMATPRIAKYIRCAFEREARRQDLRTIVEKTCANTLRVAFVARVLPEAKFIYIVRDGVDVVASARERWVSGLDLGYLSKKLRYVPLTDVPRYALIHSYSRIRRLFTTDRRLAYWGPRFDGIEDALRSLSVEEVSALQWLRSVEAAERDLAHLPSDRVLRLRYEEFAVAPRAELERIAAFLGVPLTTAAEELLRTVSPASVGKGWRRLDGERLAKVLGVIGDALTARGYGHSRQDDPVATEVEQEMERMG